MPRNNLMPSQPPMTRATVVRSERISPSFQRVTVTSSGFAAWNLQGADQWFRLFLPNPGAPTFRLPTVRGQRWWTSYLAIPASQRPHCSNYTIAGWRTGPDPEVDIDVVLHLHDGAPGGAVAAWALTARPGSELALLDQGRLFDPPLDTTEYLLLGDETARSAIAGILEALPPTARGCAIIEVPTAGDILDLAGPPGITVSWLAQGDAAAPSGQAALAALERGYAPESTAYAYLAGESSMVKAGRRLLQRAGLPSSRITFTGYWKR